MQQEFNINDWNRKEIYDLYKNYEDPFFNIATYIEVSALYQFCKKNDLSFNLSLLYFSIETANDITGFRLRIVDDKLVLYDEIHGGSTILHEDNSFSFCYFKRNKILIEFEKAGKVMIEAQLKNKVFDPRNECHDIIHHSVVPWVSFTSIKHARKFSIGDTIPKIVFGKYFNEGEKLKLPISVEVHHALMDGYHVGLYFNLLQEKINSLI